MLLPVSHCNSNDTCLHSARKYSYLFASCAETRRELSIVPIEIEIERKRMHRNAVPSHTWAGKAAAQGEQESPACPRPRRPAAAPPPEFLFPLSCQHSHPSLSHEGSSSGALDITSTKNDGGGSGRSESKGTGCPPSCYCGSPPSRLGNPLIHDVQFVQQSAEHCRLSPWMLTTNTLPFN